ncbi:phage/plasmid primase, P4 family [Nesterenkonia sp. AY15]|uniref:DNA primase family protein n=1 Tax=Nesterenkonia sp. AY15 TaxID=2901139 RepID=UPI001F4C9619|nr:phage/plasmid primase, P4 family [Nesterenkonia sp. AY15]MCH8570341.1 phage/plasmid primase, P4 family [Nesterenkonia sp. AY15]
MSPHSETPPAAGRGRSQKNESDTHKNTARQLEKIRARVRARTDEAQTATPTPHDWQDHGLSRQQRIAARYATHTAGRITYVIGSGWHHWDGTRWAPDPREVHAYQALREVLEASWAEAMSDRDLRTDVTSAMTANGSAGVLALASRDKRIAVTETDVDPYLLNCANGTLDLRTHELKPHDPADRITKITRAAYHPDAAGPTWEHFLETSLPDTESRDYLQQYLGLSLIGRTIEHLLLIATGTGRNGKGVFANTMSHALADYATTAPSDMLVASRHGDKKSAGELSGLMRLRGARFVSMSELNRGVKMDESVMKRLTGGDPITAKHMGQDYVEFNPSHSLFMLTNDLPTIPADAAAAWARIRVVPFTVSFAGREDTTLEERLQTEIDAALAWAIRGLLAYQTAGKLRTPASVLARTEEYHGENDPLARFIEERCIRNPAASITRAALLDAYNTWAKENREPQFGSRVMTPQVRALDGVTESSGRGRGWQGIGLAADVHDDG